MNFAQHYHTLARPFRVDIHPHKLDAIIDKITRHQPQPVPLAA